MQLDDIILKLFQRSRDCGGRTRPKGRIRPGLSYHKGNSNRSYQNKSKSQKSTKEGNRRSGPSGQGNKDPSNVKPKPGDGYQTSVT